MTQPPSPTTTATSTSSSAGTDSPNISDTVDIDGLVPVRSNDYVVAGSMEQAMELARERYGAKYPSIQLEQEDDVLDTWFRYVLCVLCMVMCSYIAL